MPTDPAAAGHRLWGTEDPFRLLVQTVRDYAIFLLDAEGRVASWNEGARRIKGYTADQIIGRHFSIFYPPEDVESRKPWYELEVATAEGRFEDEGWRVRRDGSRFWANVVITTLRNSQGEVVGFAKVTRDLTERKRSEEQRAELIREQAVLAESEKARGELAFLAHASAVLASSLDYEATLQELVHLVVPTVADACVVDLLNDDGSLRRMAEAHADPAKEPLVRRLGAYPPRPGSAHPIIQTLASGQSTIGQFTDDLLAELVQDEEHAVAHRTLRFRWFACVPLKAHDRVLGVLSMFCGEARHAFRPTDLPLLEELARRAALAISHGQINQQLQDAVRAREELIGQVAHDLRAPLARIKLLAQLTGRQVERSVPEPDRATIHDRLNAINRTADRMAGLLQELVDVSRLETGRSLELVPAETDLVDLVQHLAQEYAESAPDHPVRVEAQVPQLTGNWDAVRLERIVDNLLSNATKYSPRGAEVVVRVGAADGWATLQVVDQGIGIPAQDLPRIFERFHRAVNARVTAAGTGLGLAGTRQIVEQHGGAIDVQSQEGVGTTVTVRLPHPGGILA